VRGHEPELIREEETCVAHRPDSSVRRVRFDLPTPDNESQPFWDATREHRLVIKRCAACGRAHFYPRPFCPHCWSEQVHWEDASGRATLYTYSVVHVNDLPPFNERVPYVAAIVDLEEGPRAMTNVVECDVADLRVGMSLEATFQPISDEVTIPVFRPAGAR
jgi:uncharacterized OB-fold protein